jgi:signal transduction histidine kinase
MKLATRLGLSISVGILAVLGAGAWVWVDWQRAEYRADVVRDHYVLGRALAGSAELVWRTQGRERALELVEQLDRREERMSIRFVRLKTPPDASRRPLLTGVDLGPERPYHSTVRQLPGEPPAVVSYIAAPIADRQDGAIEFVEPLAEEEAHARDVLTQALAVTAVLVLSCTAIALFFGFAFVGRPLRRLTEKARRIGAGDLSGPLLVRQRDEVRELADEMNAMCERLAEAHERVGAESEARIRALQQLRHADRLRTVGEVASAMAHELGTPLNLVRMRGEMVATGEVEGDGCRRAGEIIVRESDRMAVTLRQLLDFARREAPRIATEDLSRVARETVRLLAPVAERSGVALDLSAGEPVPLEFDGNQIRQALTNLVHNALQATPPGGRVSVSVGTNGAGALVEVRDTGEGIAPEHLSRIFEPFFTTKRPGEGTGLGLSVADGIVREHGGTIDVASEPGAGSRFTVHLPREVRR